MASGLVEFWRRCNGPVHPQDEKALALLPGIFNLDFPPPAYVGDIEFAPVILLLGNGGYKPEVTPSEFPDVHSVDLALKRLHSPAPMDPAEVCSYYASANYARWLKSGDLALINAVPYRAPNITADVQRISKKLVSTRTHIRWLYEELLPAALNGKRLIIAHRNRLWDLNRANRPGGVHFTSNPVSEALSKETLGLIEHFISARSS